MAARLSRRRFLRAAASSAAALGPVAAMEGDVTRTIGAHRRWIGHFHTGGVPGRHDIDDTQELNYHAACRICQV